jgi:formyltetrahydrofolate-dependent phosphoribosylglycinamide formyltransferase
VLRIAVFVSGRGSNLKAILDSPFLKNKIQVVAVLSDKENCPAFEIAREHSIDTYNIGKKENFIRNDELKEFLKKLNPDLVVLAGYLKLIPSDVVKNFTNKIINIHPALLPAFGGDGMYGMNVHRAVFNSSAKVSGATVHFVNEIYDSGKIIAQKCVDISGTKSPEEIAEAVLKVEHKILPEVILAFTEKRIQIVDSRVVVN